jgi:hypothetical protein
VAWEQECLWICYMVYAWRARMFVNLLHDNWYAWLESKNVCEIVTW